MDISTIIGLIAGALVILKAVWSNPAGVYDGLTLLVVLVGGIASTLVAYPFRELLRVFGIVKKVFLPIGAGFRELIETIVGFAETARREGILALEQSVQGVDSFMATGIRLAVDGTEPELIQTILETELSFVEERHRTGQRLLKALGVNWAIFGGVGALVALILMPGGVESGFDFISQTSLPLLYGLLLGGLFAIFLRRKLEVCSEEEVLAKRMIMEGIMSVQSGDNPRIVEQKLNVFIAPKLRVRSATSLGTSHAISRWLYS